MPMKSHNMAPEVRFRFRGQRQHEISREFFFEDCLPEEHREIHVFLTSSELIRRKLRLQDGPHFCLKVIVSRYALLPDDLPLVIRFDVSENDLPIASTDVESTQTRRVGKSLTKARSRKLQIARTAKMR